MLYRGNRVFGRQFFENVDTNSECAEQDRGDEEKHGEHRERIELQGKVHDRASSILNIIPESHQATKEETCCSREGRGGACVPERNKLRALSNCVSGVRRPSASQRRRTAALWKCFRIAEYAGACVE